jgi:hypothetical protein
MSRHQHVFDRRFSLTAPALLLLCLALSACGGGGGGGVASIPPPPPAPPPPTEPAATVEVQTSWLRSPATRAGNYGLIGRLTLSSGASRNIAPGEFTMGVSRHSDDEPMSYDLHAKAGVLPSGLTSVGVTAYGDSWTINLNPPSWTRDDYPFGGDWTQYLGQRFTAFSKPDDGGAETKLFSYDLTRDTSVTYQTIGDKQLKTTLDYDIGYSYVAMGEWAWQVLDLNGNPSGESGSLLFVNGDRTPGSGIPSSGKATYDARTLGATASSSLPFSLTADFGQRSISTEISQASVFDVSGSAPFSNDGTFDIPLSGSAGSQSATGSMDGAFFGPHAEQVGGVFSVESQGSTLMQDAFVGQQQPH